MGGVGFGGVGGGGPGGGAGGGLFTDLQTGSPEEFTPSSNPELQTGLPAEGPTHGGTSAWTILGEAERDHTSLCRRTLRTTQAAAHVRRNMDTASRN